MGVFRFNFEQDFRHFLSEYRIPISTYKELEFCFRQILSQSWATAYKYDRSDSAVSFQTLFGAKDIRATLARSVYNWENRYSAHEYGFGALAVRICSARKKGRTAYRTALKTFDSVLSLPPYAKPSNATLMRETWLNDLRSKLNLYSKPGSGTEPNDTDLLDSNTDYYKDYVAIAHAVFLPYFVSHFKNRYGLSDLFYEFIVLKLSMETGRPIRFEKLGELVTDLSEPLQLEVRRLGLNSNDLLDQLPGEQMNLPGLRAS